MKDDKDVKYYKDEGAEKEIIKMEKIIKSGKFEESYIRELVARQKGELSVHSKYYDENIAEGNWSLIEEDSDIEKLDKFDAEKEIYGISEYSERKKDAEYEYVFIPSYYAVKTLILYYIYMKGKKKAERIYGLKNAVVRRDGKKFYGGLPFILKYIGGDFEDNRIDFKKLTETLLDSVSRLEKNNDNNFIDDFINDIIDCLNDFYGKNLILERRIKNFNEAKDNWFYIDFNEEIKKERDYLLSYTLVNDCKILMHRDVEKDLNRLQKKQAEKAKEKISKTPNYPNNDSPEDSELLKGDLKGWLSQRISKKDRLVYKIESDKKIVYIAAAYGHYDEAPRRSKSTASYR